MLRNKISYEKILLPYKNGVKLFNPDECVASYSSIEPHRLLQIFALPACISLMDTNSAIQHLNDEGLKICGHNSLKDALSKTMVDVADKVSAQQVIANHRLVISSKQSHILDEDVILKNQIQFQSVGIFLPWHDENKIIGLFACNLVIGNHSLAKVFSYLMQLGFLKNSNEKPIFNLPSTLSSVHLSYREKQCIYYYCHGKTSKEIGKILNLSYRTIEHYIENIKNKLDVSSKSELISIFKDQ